MIWLKRYIEGATQETAQMQFAELSLYERKNTSRSTVRLLNQDDVSHLLSHRRVWQCVISANETTTASKRTFLDEFWTAHRVWISFATTPISDDWIEVSLPDGDAPREFVEGHKLLAEDSFALTETRGSLG